MLQNAKSFLMTAGDGWEASRQHANCPVCKAVSHLDLEETHSASVFDPRQEEWGFFSFFLFYLFIYFA